MDANDQFPRSVLVSIRPYYVSKILDGEKTVELRRRFPRAMIAGATALIYSSSPVSAVVGYARIKQVVRLPVSKIWKQHGADACVSKEEFKAYFAGVKFGFAIFFEDVHALKRCVKANDLQTQFGIVPPQSYRYVTDECLASLSDDRFQASNRHTRLNRARRPSARSGVPGRLSAP
jgi:predicted transcriptional regulator